MKGILCFFKKIITTFFTFTLIVQPISRNNVSLPGNENITAFQTMSITAFANNIPHVHVT